jgi:hypothetical protein
MAETTEEKKNRFSLQYILHSLRIYTLILPYKWHFIHWFHLSGRIHLYFRLSAHGITADHRCSQDGNIQSERVKEIGWVLVIVLTIQAVLSYFPVYLLR